MSKSTIGSVAPAKNTSPQRAQYTKRTVTKPAGTSHPAATVSHQAMHGTKSRGSRPC